MQNYRDLPYASDKPYPSICVVKKNRNYGKWMLDNMGGSDSEMTTISLYLYNNLMTESKYGDIAYLFHKMSIVEMHHLKIFGSLACLLGEEPRLWTNCQGRMSYWTPTYNNYPKDMGRMLQNALKGELGAIEKYQQQVSAIDDMHIVVNLERIIMDEKVHVSVLKQIMKDYKF